MTENGFINTKAVSYTIDAELEIPEGGVKGVILSQAGQFGGWSLYVKDGQAQSMRTTGWHGNSTWWKGSSPDLLTTNH